ncbi:17628_t:CDS:1, partial [Funneliformis caledonium]
LTCLLHTINKYVKEYFPENKKVRLRIVMDEVWNKDAPTNTIWWTVNDRGPPSPLFKSIDLKKDEYL